MSEYASRPIGEIIAKHAGGGTPSRQVSSYWNGPIPWASVKDFPEDARVIAHTEEHISLAGLSSSASNLVPAGIPLVCTRMAVGRVAMPIVPMAINQDVRALFPKDGVPSSYLLKVLQYIRQKAEDQSVGSTVKGIRVQDYLKIEVPIADGDAQPVIAQVLDTLDTAIAQTEAIIAKLKAVKQGLLHDLLTRGIDANGELRPPQREAPRLYKQSELGWIPKEWDATKFAEVGEVVLGRQSAPRYRQGRNMRPYLRVVNIANDRLDLRDVKVMNFDSSDFSRFRLQCGDVLLTEGDLASAYTVGRTAVYRGEIEDCCFQNTLLRFRPTHPRYADYFHYACCHLRATGRFAVATTATTVHHLSAGRLEAEVVLPLALPDEMEGIARMLTGIEARIDAEADELRKRREQKEGLVDDLITGTVRVTPLLETAAA